MGRPAIEIFVTMSPLPELEAPGPSIHKRCTQSVMTFGSQPLGSCMHVPVQAIMLAVLQLERDKFSWPCSIDIAAIRLG